MAQQTLLTGAKALNSAASWSGAGITDDDGYIIGEGSQHIDTSLDASGATTTGIEYMHAVSGSSIRLGKAGAPAILEFKTAFTDRPNFQWSGRGEFYLTAATTTCTRLLLDGPATGTLVGGTFTNIIVQNGKLTIESAVDFTNLYVVGPGYVDVEDGNSGTLIRVEGGQMMTKRKATTLEIDGGTQILDTDTDDFDSFRMGGGKTVLLSGDLPVSNLLAGELDVSRARQSVEIAATSGILLPSARLTGEHAANVTINANLVREGTQPPAPSIQFPGGGFAGT